MLEVSQPASRLSNRMSNRDTGHRGQDNLIYYLTALFSYICFIVLAVFHLRMVTILSEHALHPLTES